MKRIKKIAAALLPEPLLRIARRAYYRSPALRRILFLPSDLARLLRGERGRPPGAISLVGDGNFELIGETFLGYFRDLCGLRPRERVLDVGCGVGRMAVPLAGYLDPAGEYSGFDVFRPAVEWCRKSISTRHPNFCFWHLDVFNDQYNPGGKMAAADCAFPFENGYFDFAFATSVFTHMRAEDCSRYFSEIRRVLKPGGRALLTFFLVDDQIRPELAAGRSRFRYPFERGFVIDPRFPEAAIAHDWETLRGKLNAAGLLVREPVLFGNWSGRVGGFSSQDIVIVDRQP